MKIFFLHGLESDGLSKSKRKAIESLGHEVHAPLINYKKGSVFYGLIKQIEDYKPDLIMGSSIGGRLSYHISNKLKIDAILFNPAIDQEKSNKYQPIPEKNPRHKNQLFVFGAKDTVVPPEHTKSVLPNDIHYYTVDNMRHRISASEIKKSLIKF